MFKKKTNVNYTYRKPEFFNYWRFLFQHFVTFFYFLRLKIVYRLEVNGEENFPKDNKYIVAPNHLSTLDPPLMGWVIPRGVAFMAKIELFDNPFMRWWLDWLGTFGVNREKLDPSTIKTILSLKKTDWVLGIFPQGTRNPGNKLGKYSSAFASIAKTTKCDIVPVGIIGTDKVKKWMPFSAKITVNIGKPIPYSDNPEETAKIWAEEVCKLANLKNEQ